VRLPGLRDLSPRPDRPNKLAAGRLQDLADVEVLERLLARNG